MRLRKIATETVITVHFCADAKGIIFDMKMGMKFLFRFMLTFLIVLCVITVVAIFVQLGDGDGDDSQVAVYASDRNRVEGSIEESDDGSPVHIEETDGRRTWRASSESPENSELMPGDAVVLGVTTTPIRVPLPDPDEDLPYGMVGVGYELEIETTGFVEGTYWEWDMPADRSPVPGLSFSNPSPNLAIIRGNPTEARATPFPVTIRIWDGAPNDPDSIELEVHQTTIRIWDRPTFRAPNFLDGMSRMDYAHVITAEVPDIDDVEWVWDVDGLPNPTSDTPGISITPLNPDPTIPGVIRARIEGMTATEVNRTFQPTVSLRATFTNLRPEHAFINGAEISSQDQLPAVVFSLTILPQPVITFGRILPNDTHGEAIPGDSLPDGMVAPDEQLQTPLLPPTEPFDDVYGVWFNVDHVPDGVTWSWEFAYADLTTNPPNPAPTPIFPTGLPPSWLAPPTSTIPIFYEPLLEDDSKDGSIHMRGLPQGTGGDFRITVRLVITPGTSDNPNFNGITSGQHFPIRIWPRTYLHFTGEIAPGVDMQGGLIFRAGTEWNSVDVADPNFNANLFTIKRAVMPGTRGVIRAPVPGFVRWEVVSGRPTSSHAEIGGPRNYGHNHNGIDAFVFITMPIMPNQSVTEVNRDVHIRGFVATKPIISEASLVLEAGTEGRELTRGLSLTRDSVIGVGPRGLRWDIVDRTTGELPTDPLQPTPGLPRGLDIYNRIAGYSINIVGTPEESHVNPFRFTIGVTLPGTMRIDYDASIIINPRPPVQFGNVNFDSSVDLADLVQLARRLADRNIIINEEAADLNQNGEVDFDDWIILARFFSQPGVQLQPQPQTTTP